MSSNVYTIVPWSNLKPPMQWFGLRHCPHSVKAPSPRSLLVNKANSIDKSNPEKSEIVHQVDFKTPTAKLIASWHTVVIIVTTVTNHHKKYLSTQLLHHVTSYIYIYTWPGTLQVYSQDSNPKGDESISPFNLTSIWYQSNIVRHQMDQSEAVFLAQVLIPPSVHQSMTLASWMPSSSAGRGESGTVSTWSMRQFKYTNMQM